ncbi:hypothetical protein BDZ89DRAFT_304882 [Hymenopellis radicata]|nr:hypothetical protein BDZ89DRAFT_304882 [Hymenopellis radicata]
MSVSTVDVPSMNIVIDNTDEGILYKGSNWTTVGPFADGYGVPVYNGSQSMAQGTGHEFAYNFGGKSIAVFGSWDYTDNPLPVCELDGLVIFGPSSEHINARTRQMKDEADNFYAKLLLATNQMPLCGSDGLDGTILHRLVVKTSSDVNTRLVFDYLIFTSDTANDPRTTWTYNATHPSVHFFGIWESTLGRTTEEIPDLSYDYRASRLAISNASLSFGFYGSQITMVGILDNTQGPAATGEYSIDDKPPTLFSLSNTANSRGTLFQQTIFTSDPLPADAHDIVVRWNGQRGQQRFGFTNFYVQRVDKPVWLEPTAAIVSPSPISTQSQTSSLTQSSASSSTQSSQTAASETAAPTASIVGGIVGGVVAVVAMMMFIWFLRRRRRGNGYENYQPTEWVDPDHDAHQRVQTDPLLGYVVEPLRLSTIMPGSSRSEYRTSRSVTLSVSGMSTRTSIALLKEKQSQAVRVGEMHADPDAVELETTEFLVHRDSGLRLSANTREGRRVVEVPPGYMA